MIICSESEERPKNIRRLVGDLTRIIGKKKVRRKVYDKVKNKIYFIMNAVATGALKERVSVVGINKVRKSHS